MEGAWMTVIATAVSVVITLVVTLLFNKLVGLPGEIKKQKAAETEEKEKMKADIAELKAQVGQYPQYRQQSLAIQQELRSADTNILAGIESLQASIVRLEHREKNSLRAKILNEYRIFTDKTRNPMQTWTEMEHHSFFQLIADYEALGGNDYVHSTVLPEVNRLEVLPMTDLEKIQELYRSRKA